MIGSTHDYETALPHCGEQQLSDVGLIVPTCNAGIQWDIWQQAYALQVFKSGRVLIIDSTSHDNTVLKAKKIGYETLVVRKSDFNHGGTRKIGTNMLSNCNIIVFLTQDAVLASPESIKNLITVFDDEDVGAAYGRQLPHPDSGSIGAHARLYNYPDRSELRDANSIPTLGLKAAFISNSFAAYRRDALLAVGGFPSNTIFGEDTIVAGKMLLNDWKIAYVANAIVFHSHDYKPIQEFRRYFDIGVLHSRESWLLERFSKPEGEGKKFVISEWCYLVRHAPLSIPSAIARTFLKYLGYRLGRLEPILPSRLKRYFSMHKNYWTRIVPGSH